MSRLDIQRKLKNVCGNIYFQPTEATKLKYPCVLYEQDGGINLFANNRGYARFEQYQLTVITTQPDSELPNEVMDEFDPNISYDNSFVSDNLYHTTYQVTDVNPIKDNKWR